MDPHGVVIFRWLAIAHLSQRDPLAPFDLQAHDGGQVLGSSQLHPKSTEIEHTSCEGIAAERIENGEEDFLVEGEP